MKSIEKQQEYLNQIHNSEFYYRSIVETSQEGIWIINKEYTITYVNTRMAEFLKYDVNEITGSLLFKYIDEEEIPKIKDYMKNRTLGIKETYEFKFKRKDNTYFWAKISGSPLLNNQGDFIGSLAMISDISDLKILTETLKESEKKYRDLIESIVDGIALFDMNNNRVYANQSYYDNFELKKEELNSNELLSRIHPDDLENIKSRMTKLRTNKEFYIEFRYQKTDGKLYHFGSKTTLIRDEQNQPSGYLSIIRDITQKKLSELSIIQSEKELKELNAAKDKFFSIIAHDLRSPLSAFLSLTDLLINEFQELSIKDLNEVISKINSSSKNLYKLLNNLLQWSQLQQGIIRFKPSLFNLFNIVIPNLEIYYQSAEEKNINLNVDIDKSLNVYVDLNMFDTIVRNLISNSLKFTKINGSIIITAKQLTDNLTEIKVIDNGVGMSQDVVDKLFTIGELVTNVGTMGETGTGLGLILCKEFIIKIGGTIRVLSEEGKGSSFIFTVPSNFIE